MNAYNQITPFPFKGLYKMASALGMLLIPACLFAQQATVLPGNGNFAPTSGPQGGLRYQRGFYLITPNEMKASGLTNGMGINSIGFTIGAKQNAITKGAFKVYLQNTTDSVSRVDTGWTNVTTPTNSYSIPSGLFPGNYEWQVRSVCSSNSPYSAIARFSNNDLGPCGQPTNLTTSNITASSAKLNWEAPSSTVIKYYIQYKSQESVNWTLDSTTNVFYNATGLLSNKTYQWRVKTFCSSGNPDFVSGSFITDAAVSCNAPSALTVGTVGNTTAQVSWTAAAGASYYSVQYRRIGTANWFNTTVFSNSVSIQFNLVAGTTYEWQLRTVCPSGVGGYIPGPNFTTTGTTVCYEPINLSANSITDSSVVFKWGAVSGATSYELRYRLKETILWTNAITPPVPMILVHNDSLTIPDIIGPYDVSFTGGSSFTYGGNGVYVAWEYSQSSFPITNPNNTNSTTANTTIKDINGLDSAKVFLSFIGKSDTNVTALQTRLVNTNLRPETRFGSSLLKDSAAVLAVYALGNTAPAFTAASITALIHNYATSSRAYPVTLTVKEVKTNAIRYTATQNLNIAADTSQLLEFTGWIPSAKEKDSIIISIPAQPNENVVNNNRNIYVQNVGSSIVSFDDGSNAAGKAGFDSLPGLLLARYYMKGCGKINSTQVYLSSSAKGHSVYAVALDTSGTVIAQSAAFTPDSTQVNNYHSFYFTNAPLLKNVHYYVGLAQAGTSAGHGFFPVGVQWENGYTRDSAYFTSKLNGDSIRNQPGVGRLMIKAELSPGVPTGAITGNLVLCANASSVTLTASSIKQRFADAVIGLSTEISPNEYSAKSVLGSPDVYPNYGINTNAWTSNTADGRREYLVLSFPNAAPINVIDIYETFNPGAVDTVFVKNPGTGNYDIVYSATAKAAPKSARLNRISFAMTPYNVSVVRIAIASDVVTGYNAIDAVAIGQLTTPGVFSSYLWAPGGGTGQTKIATNAGGYKLTVTDAAGCSGSDSVTIVTPVQTVPIITASGSTAFCQGDSIWLRSNKKGGNTWSTGATTDSITVKISGTYSVIYDDGSGCGTTTSSPVVVSVNNLPVITISGNPGICPASSTTLTAVVSGSGNTYLWSNGVTTNTNVISVPGPVSVLVTNSDGCKASTRVTTFYVSSPAPGITGNTSFCPGGSANLDAGAGYSSYVWSTGQTGTAAISVNATGKYYVTVTNIYGCSGSDTVNAVRLEAPVPFITGGLSLCAGPTTLNAGGGYGSYLWSTGETSQTINVNSSATFSVTVTDIFGCTGSKSVTTAHDSLPATPGPINGSMNGVCNSPGTVFTINPVPNTTHYVWFVPPGASIVSGQGETSVVLAFDGSFTSGDLIVAASNACGQSGTLNARIFPLNGEPANPTVINGEIAGVCGQTKTYSTPAVSSATSYTWTTSTGITITGGQGTSSITVSFSIGFVSGNICVKANNACGSSQQKCISITGPPSTPAAITGPITVCFRQSNVIYSIPAVTGAVSYNWAVPQQATIVSGQGTTSIRVNFGNKSGNVTVAATNSCGNSQQSLAVVASNCPGNRTNVVAANSSNSAEKKMEPEVIANDGGINILGNMQVEWTLGEPAIESITAKNKLYTQGFHQPLVLKSARADEIVLQNEGDLKIIAAPNPVQFTLRVSFSSKKDENLVLKLTEMNGRVLFIRPLRGSSGTIDINMSSYSGGMYLLNIQSVNDGFSRNIKVVKAN